LAVAALASSVVVEGTAIVVAADTSSFEGGPAAKVDGTPAATSTVASVTAVRKRGRRPVSDKRLSHAAVTRA
jgi:hypothetical protein